MSKLSFLSLLVLVSAFSHLTFAVELAQKARLVPVQQSLTLHRGLTLPGAESGFTEDDGLVVGKVVKNSYGRCELSSRLMDPRKEELVIPVESKLTLDTSQFGTALDTWTGHKYIVWTDKTEQVEVCAKTVAFYLIESESKRRIGVSCEVGDYNAARESFEFVNSDHCRLSNREVIKRVSLILKQQFDLQEDFLAVTEIQRDKKVNIRYQKSPRQGAR